jgi:putative DNA methylase
MTNYPKRLIEVDLPIARISAHARREKSIRHGHISTLHIWWARRPLAACRAVICAALWPDPADEHCPQSFRDAAARQLIAFAKRVNPDRITEEKRQLQDSLSPESRARWEVLAKNDPPLDPADAAYQNVLRFALLDFIADFANWDNSTAPAYLETSRALTQAAHEALGGDPGTRPLVVDPFAGGGSIPLEALRVGADAFASDLNPVAVLLNKVVLEYIPKYGQKLADEVRKWGQWIKEQAEKDLAEFYPKDTDGATPIAYLWARTILSEAPGQNDLPVELPLIRSLWLSKKKGRNRALRWVRDSKGQVKTQVVDKTFVDGVKREVRHPMLEIFEPRSEKEVERGTSAGGSATCPVTEYTTSVEGVRIQMK